MDENIVTLAHGSGGEMGHALVRSLLDIFDDAILEELEDAALAPFDGEHCGGRIAFTTDSYVVRPLSFPGGDIGKLAVCGTINDLAMRGAMPLYLSAGFIIEEGLPLADLKRVAASMAEVAHEAGVRIVTGDTKVVERGSADRLFLNTAGVGVVPADVHISASAARPGDVILLSGAVGDHGLAIMTQREGLRFESPLRSDCAPLHTLVQAMLEAGPHIHTLRDPTRGGLATTLNELADQSGVGMRIEETSIPIHEPVRAASELLGLDPLYVANEGKLVAVVEAEHAGDILRAMRAHPQGREAAIIGEVVDEHVGRVAMRTILGTHRLLDMLASEQLPRIC